VEPDIASNIKKYRKLRGLTIEELAEKVGVTRQSVMDWEAGTTPRKAKLDILSKVLGVKFSYGMVEEEQATYEVKEEKEPMDQLKETFYTELIEKNEEYALVPKSILRDYKIVPDKIMDIIIRSNEGERDALIAKYDGEREALLAKHELIITTFENKVKKLEAEKEELQRQIAAKSK
jgi:transcriptional regulator with XRE-family HTH domain